MKTKIILLVAVLAIAAGTAGWFAATKLHWQLANADRNKILYYTCPMHPDVHADKPGKCPECGMNLVPVYAKASAAAPARTILYYQSAMHPWIKSDKPGKCPICGMDLVPVYAGDSGAETNMPEGMVKLNVMSISVINVQTDVVTNRPIARTLHFGGEITANSWNAVWFEFTAYQRDLAWLKVGQKLQVTLPGTDKIYTAQINVRGVKPFADKDFDSMTTGVKVRA